MNKTKRFCAIALAALMGVSVFAGCGTDSTTDTSSSSGDTTSAESTAAEGDTDPLGGEGELGTIELKVWAPDAATALVQEQCNQFAEEYSAYGDISITVVTQGESDAATNVMTDPEAAADVFGFACDQLNKLVTTGVLLEVTGDDATWVEENNTEDSVNAASIDGQIYAYPETGDNSYCLFYNKEYVSDEDAQTLEGVLAACKAANKKFAMDGGNGYYACMFMFTGGLTINGLEEDGVTQVFSDYDEDTAIATLKAFKELFTEYSDIILNGDETKVNDGFKSDTVAAGVGGSWSASTATETLGDNAGFAILPTIDVDGTATQIVNMFGYKCLGVNASTAYPNTSIELAKYLTNEECQQERADELGWGPSNKVVAESDTVVNSAAMSTILAQAQYSVAQVSVSDTFWTPVGTLGTSIIDSTVTLADDDAYRDLINTTIANVRDE